MSQYGNWFGIPIGIFAMIYWGAVILLSMVKSIPSNVFRLILIPPVVVNVFLAAALLVDVSLGCIVCYLNYAAWLGVLITGWNWKSPATLTKNQAAIAWIIFASVVSAYTFYEVQELRKTPEDLVLEGISEEEKQRFAAYFASLTREQIPEVSKMSYGPADAKVTITEFSDFGCPHCAKAATTLVPELKKIKDVRIVYYPLPIDPACHPEFMGKGPSNGRCEWAKGVICASKQNKTWEYHDKAFRVLLEQGNLPKFSMEYVDGIGLDPMSFEACTKMPEVDEELKALICVSNQLNIQGAPTFFVNGRGFRGLPPIKTILAAIIEARKDGEK